MWFVESRNTCTSEEDLVVIVVEHDITSHKEGDTTEVSLANLKVALQYSACHTIIILYS